MVASLESNKKAQKSLQGSLGDKVKNSSVTESAVEAVNYGELVNRSETGTALAKANYI